MPVWTMAGRNPCDFLNMNDRDHFRVENVKKRAWFDDAYWRANRGAKPKIAGLATIAVDFGVTDPNRRRDPHNWFKTVKPIVDALTKAGFWPDDDSLHVTTVEPKFFKSTVKTYRVTVTWEEPT